MTTHDVQLLDFQERAATQVAERYARHVAARAAGGAHVPFYQAFAAVTQSGKTVVLAESVTRVAAAMSVKPLVLWLSRGRVAAQRAWDGLQPGRRHRALLGAMSVRLLADVDAAGIADADAGMVCFATVETFGVAPPERELFSVCTSDVDALDAERLDALRGRADAGGSRRPPLLVYDEAHPLADAQTDRLLALEPDLVLFASATMKPPPGPIVAVADRLRADGWLDSELATIPRLARAGRVAS